MSRLIYEQFSYSSLFNIAIIGIVFSGCFSPYIFIDMSIEAPSTASLDQTFIISGNSYLSAAERVNLYLLDKKEPIGYSIVNIRPPYDFEFEITVTKDSLSVNGETFYEGSTEGKPFHFYVVSTTRGYNISPIISVTIE
ncbi:hypothetical protein [[Eubacterium] cellulosolvens]|nr:hypothetical protein E2P64_04740 [Candidatus Bathyarchaeota archaeon]